MYTLQGLREVVPISLSQDVTDLPEQLQNRKNLCQSIVDAASLG